MEAKKRDARLWELVRKLTAMMIPYCPPLKGAALKGLEKNNPKGYALLEEYLELKEEELAEEIAKKGYARQVYKTIPFGSGYWVTEYVTLEEKERIEKEERERKGE